MRFDRKMGEAFTQLAAMDLNLLVILRELLRERNVTKAGERVGLSQPAASAALARLRRQFGDDLLVRDSRSYVLSPLAAALVEEVEAACAAAERVFATGMRFDPSSSSREFTLLMADYTIAVIGEKLATAFEEQAPHTTLHVRLVREALAAAGADVFRGCDGIVAPPASGPAVEHVQSTELFRDRWVCVTSADNEVPDQLALEDLERCEWVIPYHRLGAHAPLPPISRQLSLLGITPRVAVRVESYQLVPYFVAGTSRIALLQERIAVRAAPRFGLRILPCPGNPEPIVEALWWPRERQHDPAFAWLRDVLVGCADDCPDVRVPPHRYGAAPADSATR
jgi:DNA-binding transcriptional LysR family regulator